MKSGVPWLNDLSATAWISGDSGILDYVVLSVYTYPMWLPYKIKKHKKSVVCLERYTSCYFMLIIVHLGFCHLKSLLLAYANVCWLSIDSMVIWFDRTYPKQGLVVGGLLLQKLSLCQTQNHGTHEGILHHLWLVVYLH